MSNKKTEAKVPGKVSIVPLSDRVLIRPIGKNELENKSASGIIIPANSSREVPDQGIVVAVGPGRYDDGGRIPMSVKVGDKVLFTKYGHEEVNVNGEELFIFSESSILAVIS
jgi:chaperonin GroES